MHDSVAAQMMGRNGTSLMRRIVGGVDFMRHGATLNGGGVEKKLTEAM